MLSLLKLQLFSFMAWQALANKAMEAVVFADLILPKLVSKLKPFSRSHKWWFFFLIIHAVFSFLFCPSSLRRHLTDLPFSTTHIFFNFILPLNTVPQYPNAQFTTAHTFIQGSDMPIYWHNWSEMQIALIKIHYLLCFLITYS